MRLYPYLLYHDVLMALDLFPHFLLMEKTYQRSPHNNAHAHRPLKVDRLRCRGYLRRVMGNVRLLKEQKKPMNTYRVGVGQFPGVADEVLIVRAKIVQKQIKKQKSGKKSEQKPTPTRSIPNRMLSRLRNCRVHLLSKWLTNRCSLLSTIAELVGQINPYKFWTALSLCYSRGRWFSNL
jgi:hypothetical protein